MATENDFYEDDVIIEGSDLHRALIEMGCTDFECTPVNRSDFPDDWDDVGALDKISTAKLKNKDYLQIFKNMKSIPWFFRSNERNINGVKYLEIILKLKPLLDDHSSMILNIVQQYSEVNESKFIQLLSSLVPYSILSVASFFNKNLRIPGFIALSALASIKVSDKLSAFRMQKYLNNLVSVQNDIHNLHKRALKILKHGYGLKMDSRRSQRKFSQLEVEKLKYLQPICDNLVRSIENCCRIFYNVSRLLAKFLPKTIDSTEMFTKFEMNEFTIIGEITHKSLKQLYYVYILVQSDMMYILAMLCSSNSMATRNIQLKLSQIIYNLSSQLNIDNEKLKNAVQQYQSHKAAPNRREIQKSIGSKWQDLYLHVDLLSRKLQLAYGTVGSILEEIDDFADGNDDEFLESIMQKMNEAQKQVNTAQNFAEFSTLLINKFRSTRIPENCGFENNIGICEEKKVLPVIFDADPEIIDEVFEEYIKEEYLKPLYEDKDIDMERARLDRLLERNFMSELKGVLIDKYKSMSERETKALMRNKKNDSNRNIETETSIIPPAPILPMPSFSERFESKNRRPIPLPRRINSVSEDEKINENEEDDSSKRFSIQMAINGFKFPQYSTNEETFIGSGENSEDELAGSECEDDKILD